MKIAITLWLINLCILTRASALSVEDRLVLVDHTSQLQMVILKAQQETIDQLQWTLKTHGETVKTQQGTIDQLQRTLKTQSETVKTQQETSEKLRRTQKTQEETVKTQQETINRLERTLKTQGETVNTQQETIDQLQRLLKEPGETVEKHQETIDNLRSISKTQEETVMHNAYANRALKTFLVNRQADSMNIELEHTNLSQQNRDSSASMFPSVPNRIKRQQSTNVAFHAYVTTQTCVNDREIIIFDREELDLPGGFNNGVGIYTVPQSGTYVFTWTFVTKGRTWYKTEILINGNVKGSNVAAAHQDTDPQSASGTIVTRVYAGDHVYVRKASGDNCVIEHTYSRSTFSGWKLF